MSTAAVSPSCPSAIISVLDRAAVGRSDVAVVTGIRGSGKTRLIEIVTREAAVRGMNVLTMRSAAATMPIPYQGVQDLIRPYLSALESLVPDHAIELRHLSSGRTARLDPGAVRIGILRLVRAIAATAPTCVVADDIDCIDRQSFEIVMFVMARLDDDRIAAVVSARRPLEWDRSVSIVLDPLPDDHVTAVLADRGLAAGPARACARAAKGLPGMAIALADGLTRAQRSGRERLPPLIRPAPSLIQHQQQVLGSLAPAVQRALVVVAADELGHVSAVRTALDVLGEDHRSLEDAEAHGLIEIDGPEVRFTDPWWRPAAYYLVAPASRRAAHRALAESYAAPHQAEARAWQLAAAASGPCDRVAEALGLVAGDVARRGSVAAAVETYARAVEFAQSAAVRERLLLGALTVALDGLELTTARDLAIAIEPTTCAARVAIAEALELAGDAAAQLPEWAGSDDPWTRRRQARLDQQAAARGGNPIAVDSALEAGHPAHALLAVAQAHRHGGHLAKARDALMQVETMLNPSCVEMLATVRVIHADLDHLAGRFVDCDARLRSVGRPTADWTRLMAQWIALRLDAAVDGTAAGLWAAQLGIDVATEPLSTIRAAIARGARSHDHEDLQRTADRAASLGLPVESCEARLARLESLAATGRSVDANEHRALTDQLLYLGIHAWNGRLAALDRSSAPGADAELSRLSQAERRVAEAVSVGMTNREAAASLFLSVKTVDFHLQQIYRKLALRSRTELAVLILGDDHRSQRFAAR